MWPFLWLSPIWPFPSCGVNTDFSFCPLSPNKSAWLVSPVPCLVLSEHRSESTKKLPTPASLTHSLLSPHIFSTLYCPFHPWLLVLFLLLLLLQISWQWLLFSEPCKSLVSIHLPSAHRVQLSPALWSSQGVYWAGSESAQPREQAVVKVPGELRSDLALLLSSRVTL